MRYFVVIDDGTPILIPDEMALDFYRTTYLDGSGNKDISPKTKEMFKTGERTKDVGTGTFVYGEELSDKEYFISVLAHKFITWAESGKNEFKL